MLPQTYENYALSRDTLSQASGLTRVPLSLMTRVIDGQVTSSSPQSAALVTLPVPFLGESGTRYTRAAVSHGGAIVLIDPASAPATAAEAFAHVCSSTSSNDSVLSTFPSASVLLCPWWDPQQSTVARAVNQLSQSVSATVFRFLKFGSVSPDSLPDPRRLESDGGVHLGAAETRDGRCSVIRWCNRETSAESSRLLRFDVVLYESGVAEFRYDGINLTSASAEGSAVVGAFFPSGAHRFIDASVATDPSRSLRYYGGFAYTASYSDAGAPYKRSNAAVHHWPARGQGATIRFTPPSALRQVLPKLAVKRERLRGAGTLFDDTSAVPATACERRGPVGFTHNDLCNAGGDLRGLMTDITCVASRSLDDVSKTLTDHSSIAPFTDSHVIDDAAHLFASASATNTAIANSALRMSSRETVIMNRKISRQMKFIPSVATAVAYDVATQSFILIGTDAIKLSSSEAERAAEDDIAFNAAGYWLASGSRATTAYKQSTLVAGLYDDESTSTSDTLSERYSSSMTLGDAYLKFQGESQHYEPIRVSLRDPFVVEAIELDLPITANAEWFQQMTTIKANEPSASHGGWNLGGPAATVAVLVDRGSELRRFRDVLASGSLTHQSDAMTYSWTSASIGPSTMMISPLGLRACGGEAAGVVPASSGEFTGSVRIRMPAAISVGTYMAVTGSTTAENFLSTLPVSDEIPVLSSSWNWAHARAVHVAPFGRSHDGLSVSARSLVTRDVLTSSKIKNHFTVTGSAIAALSASLGGMQYVTYVGAASRIASSVSPYVLLPGDGLRISISKSRSAVTGSAVPDYLAQMDAESGPILGLAAGEMTIKLIGRHLRNGQLFAERAAQCLDGCDVVGDIAVTDQFEFLTRTELYNTTHDGYVTGTMYTQTPAGLQVGERGRVFSVANASSSQQLDTSRYSSAVTRPSWLAGFTSLSQAACDGERLYDSMLPPIDGIVRLDGAKVLYQPSGFYILNKPSATIFFDVPAAHTASIAPYADNTWSRAYPFESRYSSLERMTDVTKLYTCDLKLIGGALGDVASLTGDAVAYNLIYARTQWRNERAGAGTPVQANLYYFYALDALGDNPPKVITAPVTNTFQTKDDLIKTLYGIGDMYSVYVTGSSAPVGSTNAPDYAGYSYDPPSSRQYVFGARPIVRGWKYGISNGVRTLSKAVWRRAKFGQPRDMLEQRIDTKFAHDASGQIYTSPIFVNFVDAMTRVSKSPLLTTSSNLSYEATSSLPYFDGETRNR